MEIKQYTLDSFLDFIVADVVLAREARQECLFFFFEPSPVLILIGDVDYNKTVNEDAVREVGAKIYRTLFLSPGSTMYITGISSVVLNMKATNRALSQDTVRECVIDCFADLGVQTQKLRANDVADKGTGKKIAGTGFYTDGDEYVIAASLYVNSDKSIAKKIANYKHPIDGSVTLEELGYDFTSAQVRSALQARIKEYFNITPKPSKLVDDLEAMGLKSRFDRMKEMFTRDGWTKNAIWTDPDDYTNRPDEL